MSSVVFIREHFAAIQLIEAAVRPAERVADKSGKLAFGLLYKNFGAVAVAQAGHYIILPTRAVAEKRSALSVFDDAIHLFVIAFEAYFNSTAMRVRQTRGRL